MDNMAILSFLQHSFPFYFWVNLLFLVSIAYNRIAIYLIRDWPSVTGIVNISRIGHRVGKGNTSDFPVIEFTYKVDGEEYTNQSISPGSATNDNIYIREMLKRFPVGAEVPVYYDPSAPGISYLTKSSPFERYILKYIIAINLLMPIVVMLYDFFQKLGSH